MFKGKHILGTGKTLTGAKLLYWFSVLNEQYNELVSEARKRVHDSMECSSDVTVDDDDSDVSSDSGVSSEGNTKRFAKRQVMYCGPSNSAVDVATSKSIYHLKYTISAN